MSTYDATYRLDRTPEEVFDVIGTHCYENHPRWEREVVEIRPLTPGPIGLGSRAIMVRQELGRRSETEYEVTAFEPARRIAFRHPQASMLFELGMDLRAAGASATDLTVHVRMEPKGALRLLSPLLALQLPRRSDRITRQMIGVVEARSSESGARLQGVWGHVPTDELALEYLRQTHAEPMRHPRPSHKQPVSSPGVGAEQYPATER